ncbi:unnamed protein product [Closterium sp. Naga37s-1]|nr:unnamed protein product [Closterium sp. Naga37s-1]
MRRSNSCDTSPVFLGLVYVSHNASGGRSSGEGIFYESTGMRGQSSVREVDVATGKVLKKVPQSAPVFSEGLALINDRLFQLAWQVKTGTIYNRKSLQKIDPRSHTSFTHRSHAAPSRQLPPPDDGRAAQGEGDGWRHTYSADQRVGSAVMMMGAARWWGAAPPPLPPRLSCLQPLPFAFLPLNPPPISALHKVKVTDGGTPIAWINELEVRGGRIYANVWQTDCIAVIDPLSGRVAAWMDLQRLRASGGLDGPAAPAVECQVNGVRASGGLDGPAAPAVSAVLVGRVAAWMDLQRLWALAAAQVKPNQEFDVLNGIAWDAQQRRLFVDAKVTSQQRRLFVTGKYWPRVFQIAPKTLTRSTADDVAAIRLSHVVVLKSFAMKPMPGVRLTLVTRDVHTPYSGMLPGLVAGHYTYDDCHIDLRPLAQLTNARLLHCCASGIDLDQRAVVLADGRPPHSLRLPGAKELTLPVKPIDSFTHRWEALRSRILSLAPGSSVRVVVVGGGAGGVELLLAMQHRLQQDCLVLDAAVVAVRQRGVESGGEGGDREGAVDGAEGEVGRGSSSGAGGGEKRESAVQGGVLVLEGGEEVEFDECVWCTQVGVLVCVSEQEGLALDSNGFIRVGDTLESISHRGVFAAGDIHSSIAHIPPPPACPISCQTPPTSYVTPLLPREEQPPGLAKRDRIDRAFMQQFNQLPAMPSPPLPTIPVAHTAGPEALLALKSMPMRCGGCGSKVGLPFSPASSLVSQLSPAARLATRKSSWGLTHLMMPLCWRFHLRERAAVRAQCWCKRSTSSAPSSPIRTPVPTYLPLPPSLPQQAICFPSVSLLPLSEQPEPSGGANGRLLPLLPLRSAHLWSNRCSPRSHKLHASPFSFISPSLSHQSPVLVQTVDFFRSFLSDPHTFGRIAALHALSDCFAMGADPVSALAIVTLPYGTEEKMEEEIFQLMPGAICESKAPLLLSLLPPPSLHFSPFLVRLIHLPLHSHSPTSPFHSHQMEEELFQVMAGAIRELDAATCQLVGGHTVEGAELSLGFAVTGLADRDRLLRKAGMHEGDAIILTKPIGTGVIFAANMRCKAKGRWVDGAIDSMLVSNQDGARQCVEDGIFSSLQDSNLRLRRAITNYEEASAHLLTLLLFDPQTAGGLLFSFHP